MNKIKLYKSFDELDLNSHDVRNVYEYFIILFDIIYITEINKTV